MHNLLDWTIKYNFYASFHVGKIFNAPSDAAILIYA